jgi:acylphosphatase
MTVARRVRVTGRVQGVFFRAWTAEEARALGLTGWVRNCSDGSVEAHVEGEADAINELVELLREGPPEAQVESIESEVADPEGHGAFEVRH